MATKLLTTGRPQRQQDDHGVDHQDVHGGRLPTGPAKENLVLGLRLQGERGWREGLGHRLRGQDGFCGQDWEACLTQLYTSSPSLLLRMRLT